MTDEELLDRLIAGETIGDGKRQRTVLVAEVKELRQLFDMICKAQQRGIERWRKATGRTMVSPDTADFIVWLLERLDRAEAVIQVTRKLGEVKIERREMNEHEAAALDVALHVAAYDKDYPGHIEGS